MPAGSSKAEVRLYGYVRHKH